MSGENIKIYHNPRCTKSREALHLLHEKGVDPIIEDYMKLGLETQELKTILKKLGIKAVDLVRTNEPVYKLEYKDKADKMTEDDWIAAMIKEPKLMERPIIIRGDKAIIARPTENLLELL